MASNESKTLWVAVLALLAFAAMMVWMLAGSGDAADEEPPTAAAAPTGPAPAAASAPKPAAAKPTAKADEPAAPAAIDPLVDVFAGPMPDFMVDIHTRVLDKKPLGVEQQKALYNFGQENKTDARPQLLLAWDSMNREWDGIAVRMYRIAYRADPRAKHDPRMLNDLISVASRLEKTEHREATAIIVEAYGGSVLPRLDDEIDALRQSGQHARSARLERVRDAVKKAATQ
jgi:hypothetical protein